MFWPYLFLIIIAKNEKKKVNFKLKVGKIKKFTSPFYKV